MTPKFKPGDLVTVRSGKLYLVEHVQTHDEIRAFQLPGWVYVEGSDYEDNNKVVAVSEREEALYTTVQIKNGKPYGPRRRMDERVLRFAGVVS